MRAWVYGSLEKVKNELSPSGNFILSTRVPDFVLSEAVEVLPAAEAEAQRKAIEAAEKIVKHISDAIYGYLPDTIRMYFDGVTVNGYGHTTENFRVLIDPQIIEEVELADAALAELRVVKGVRNNGRI